MRGYGTREVAKMLGLSAGYVRSCVRSGFVRPERGPHGEMRFSFPDLVLLRTAKGLSSAGVGPRRTRNILRKLLQQLPAGRSLAGLHVSADGEGVVVGDGTARWRPESGQILFDFGVAELAEKVAPLARKALRDARSKPLSAEDWYEWGCDLEASAPEEAREAYRRAIGLEPAHADAQLNLGRLLHESGDPASAEAHYRCALAARPGDSTAAFNLGVALEDLGRTNAALDAYDKAVSLDSGNADAHYNAANLCERLGRPAAALRHLKSYRTLIRGQSP